MFSVDGKIYILFLLLLVGWSYVDKDGNVLIGSLMLISGNINIVCMVFIDLSGQKYSYEFEFSGVLQNFDSFKLGFNDKGIFDNCNVFNLLVLQIKLIVGGIDNIGFIYNEVYGGLVEWVGILIVQVCVSSEVSVMVLKQVQDSCDLLFGVSFDEEVVNLIQFQQYYGVLVQVI